MKYFWCVILLFSLVTQSGWGQNIDGKWSLGFRGGANLWVNEMKDRKVGPGGELSLTYGITRAFSLGLSTGWQLLKAAHLPPDSTHPYSYMKLTAFPASLVAWFHLSPGSTVNPFIYVGAGGMIFKRQIEETGTYLPSNKLFGVFHIPVGIGLDAFASKNVAFHIEVGYRVLDDNSDFQKGNSSANSINGSIDSYVSGMAGLNFYFGRSRSDDDDGDGLTNGEEEEIGTNPDKTDSDDDGLTDGEEVHEYQTDPRRADSDLDGLIDGEEVKRYRTDPLRMDTDKDVLKDGEELSLYATDPLRSDSDSDGLPDGDEVLTYKTDPLKVDTDGDNLLDGAEIKTYHTDPLKADTDGGGVADGVEVSRGTNPLDPTDDIKKEKELKAEVGKAVVLEGVTFRTGSAEISASSEAILTLALNTLQQNPDITVEIQGHTDNTGSRKLNNTLSISRAESVKNWLVNRGVAPNRVTTRGYGPDRPIASNATADGRSRNRRIEFVRTK